MKIQESKARTVSREFNSGSREVDSLLNGILSLDNGAWFLAELCQSQESVDVLSQIGASDAVRQRVVDAMAQPRQEIDPSLCLAFFNNNQQVLEKLKRTHVRIATIINGMPSSFRNQLALRQGTPENNAGLVNAAQGYSSFRTATSSSTGAASSASSSSSSLAIPFPNLSRSSAVASPPKKLSLTVEDPIPDSSALLTAISSATKSDLAEFSKKIRALLQESQSLGSLFVWKKLAQEEPVPNLHTADDVKNHIISWHVSNTETFAALRLAVSQGDVQKAGIGYLNAAARSVPLEDKIDNLNAFVDFLLKTKDAAYVGVRRIVISRDFKPLEDEF